MAKSMAAASPVNGRWALPNGWVWRRARDLGKIVGGSTPKNASDPSNYSDDGIPWLTPADLSGYSRSTIGAGRRNLAPHVVNRSALLPAGAVLISSRAPVGYCAVASNPMVTNQGFRSLVVGDDVDPFFIRYYVLFSRRYLEESASGTTFKELSGGALADLVFPVPPIEVQRRIVTRIDELFAEIDDGEAALARARADLATWRKALLKAAVTGELTADWRAANPSTGTGNDLLAIMLAHRRARWEEELRNKHKSYVEPVSSVPVDAPALPTTWSWASIQQLATVVRGASPRPAGDPRYFGGDIPWITVGSLTKGNSKYLTSVDLFVTPLGREHSRYIEPGTLLFTNSGATLGVPKIISIGGCINDGSVALLGLEEPLKSYVYHFLRTQTERLRGLNQGAAQPNLNTTIVKEIIVPLPPEDEMAEIVSVVESFLNETDAGEDDLRHLDAVPSQLRQSILAAAFRGELA
jgi:type I restriction enzyme S subunit